MILRMGYCNKLGLSKGLKGNVINYLLYVVMDVLQMLFKTNFRYFVDNGYFLFKSGRLISLIKNRSFFTPHPINSELSKSGKMVAKLYEINKAAHLMVPV